MNKVKLVARLPDEDTGLNGLNILAGDLLQRPGTGHFVIALVDCAKTEVDHHRGGAKTPHAGIVEIEAIRDPAHISMTRQLLEYARDLRNGRQGTQPALFDADRSASHELEDTPPDIRP